MIVLFQSLILFFFFNLILFQIGKLASSYFLNPIINQFKSLNILIGYLLLGSIIFITNFFLPTNSIFTYLIISLLFFLSLKNFHELKYILIIFFLSLLIYPIILKINFSYDAGLYHLPYQNFLRSDKIIFGLANIPRYGFSSIQDYVSSILYTKNFIFNKFLVGSFLVIFFSFIYDLNKSKIIIDKIIIFSIIISIPFISRYFTLYILKTDLPIIIFSIIYYVFCVKYFFTDNKLIKKNLFQIIVFLLCLIFFSKTSGVISILLFTLIFFYHLKISSFYRDILKKNLILIIISALWIIKNIFISGCIFYPLEFTCFNFIEWNASDQAFMDSVSVKAWNRQPFEGLEPLLNFNWFFNYWLPTYDKFIMSILLIAFLILIKNILLLNKRLIKFYYFLILLFALFFFQQDTTIFIKEFINFKIIMIVSTLLVIPVLVIFVKNFKFVNQNLKKNRYFIIYFGLYTLISLILWFLNAPNPRFGIGYVTGLFIYIGISSFILIYDKVKLTNNKFDFKYLNLIYMFVYLLFFFSQATQFETKYSIFKTYNNSFWFLNYEEKHSSYLNDINIPKVRLTKRENYGYKTEDGSNRCWLEANCYEGLDVLNYKSIFGYKFIKRLKKFDRTSLGKF